ncbi:MAG TPA: flagellar basal body P-ring formation chaperone FlgA [Steroidobacteraceae bacterium]|nr:flagellar basal body P-ring formation chaperone FlgA [Steroidobacteraceae bacterium]
MQLARHSALRDTLHKSGMAFAVLAVRTVLAAVLLLIIYSAWFANAHADVPAQPSRAIQSLQSIREAAEAFVRGSAPTLGAKNMVIATAGELDQRLQFTQCTGPLQTFSLQGATVGARTTVGVRCVEGAEWTLYTQVAVATELDVLVLNAPAARDAHIALTDVTTERRRVNGVGSLYLTETAMLTDRRLKRSVPAGAALSVDMFAKDPVVKRGQQVSLVSSAGSIEVRAPGIALADGGNADRIRVQNLSSLKVIEGVVESGNQVRVGM